MTKTAYVHLRFLFLRTTFCNKPLQRKLKATRDLYLRKIFTTKSLKVTRVDVDSNHFVFNRHNLGSIDSILRKVPFIKIDRNFYF